MLGSRRLPRRTITARWPSGWEDVWSDFTAWTFLGVCVWPPAPAFLRARRALCHFIHAYILKGYASAVDSQDKLLPNMYTC